MAKSRNQRRQEAKARYNAKVLRQTKAKVARARQGVKDTVFDNMQKPIERNYYPASSMAQMEGSSHRGYVARASGAMSSRSANALAPKLSAQRKGDHYARPLIGDRSQWPVTHSAETKD